MNARIVLNCHFKHNAYLPWGAKEELLDIYELSNFLNMALLVAFD